MITIKEDFRYFTHLVGKESVIPLSRGRVKVYPARLEIFSCERKVTIDLEIEGLVTGFTHLLNIEKSRVEVFGSAKSYFHVFIFAEEGKIYLKLHRGKEIRISIDGVTYDLKKGEKRSILDVETVNSPESVEKVSFGCVKKPLLENAIDRTTKLYMLSQSFPKAKVLDLEVSQIEPLLIDLFSPKDRDMEYRNLGLAEITSEDLFSLFSTFKEKFRSSILTEEEGIINFLPKREITPPAGRCVGMICENLSVDVLWRKARVLRVVILPLADCERRMGFPGNAKKYRIKRNVREKGAWIGACENVSFKKGERVFIDRIIY